MNPLRVLDLFSGIGGFSLGLERTGGFKTVAFCEIEPFPRRVLAKHWPEVPCYDDVRTLTASRLRADGITRVDLVCGGFPCQDASVANVEGLGTAGDRTGLFAEAVRIVSDLRCVLLMENVTGLLGRGFGDVLRSLARIGFDAEWENISARELGADHLRDRLWILAYPSETGCQGFEPFRGALSRAKAALAQHYDAPLGGWSALVADLASLRGRDGVSVAMERNRVGSIGNAVVPQIPELIGNAILVALRPASGAPICGHESGEVTA
jgi:DNA (cytosine-5)-methyltransferase 1